MTMVAFHVTDQRTDAVVDTMWTTRGGREYGETAKFLADPDTRTIVLCQGSDSFRRLWRERAPDLLTEADSFDSFTDAAETALHETWAVLLAEAAVVDHDPDSLSANVFHLGWSPDAQGFRAYGYSSAERFARVDLTGVPYVVPAPIGVRPGRFERDGLARRLTDAGWPDDHVRQVLAKVDSFPPLPAPPGRKGWIDLAEWVHRTRTTIGIESRLKVHVGGGLIHFQLDADGLQVDRVHEFPDDPSTMAGTLHPSAQLGGCPCGSILKMVDCCLAEQMRDPCQCGSQRALVECCAVRAPTTTAEDRAYYRAGAPEYNDT